MRIFFINSVISIQCFTFFIGIILKIIFVVSFDFSFYENFYKKDNTAKAIGKSYDELLTNTDNLLNYIKGGANLNPSWFTKSDIDHMVDVKNLYLTSNTIMYSCFIISLLCTLVLIILLRKKTFDYISRVFNKILLIFIVAIVVIASFVAINFNSFWIKFHQTIFSNDLWLLDPATSTLIQMVPEQFFIALVGKIILFILTVFAVMFTLNTGYKIIREKSYRIS